MDDRFDRPLLLLLIPGFPADEQDTECLPGVQNYARALAEQQHDRRLSVVAFQYPYRRERYRWHGVPVYPLGGENRSFPRRLSTWASAIRRSFQLDRRGRVDVVHSFWLGETTLLGQWIARSAGAHHVATIPGQDALPENPYLELIDLDRVTVVSGSRFAADTFAASTDQTVEHVVPLGLDADRLADEVPPRRSRSIDLLGVGSLNEVKNFARFVRIMDRLREERPGLTGRILGDGPRRAALERLIREKELGDRITLAGRLPRPHVLRTMRRSRLLLHTARYDAQPYVFLEALASGMQIVSTPVGYDGSPDRVYVADEDERLAEICDRLLDEEPPSEPADVVDTRETVRRYRRIYDESRR